MRLRNMRTLRFSGDTEFQGGASVAGDISSVRNGKISVEEG
jgi:hypothetical protein